MYDFTLFTVVAVVLAIDILDVWKREALTDPRCGLIPPGKRATRLRLITTVHNYCVVCAGGAKKVAPFGSAVVHRRSRIDQQVAAPAEQVDRKSICVSMPPAGLPESSTIKHGVAVLHFPTRTLNEIAGF